MVLGREISLSELVSGNFHLAFGVSSDAHRAFLLGAFSWSPISKKAAYWGCARLFGSQDNESGNCEGQRKCRCRMLCLLVSNLGSSIITYSFDKHQLKPSVQQATARICGWLGRCPSPPAVTAYFQAHASAHLNVITQLPPLGDESFLCGVKDPSLIPHWVSQ